ncbi:MAG: hypothetical protein O3A95_08540 [Planctomycetota bacterium]|nr:hypothetical protein [Planctomycetota bacterium]MDA1114329.1 hypothetical protein [Planctomycetota bacterium]
MKSFILPISVLLALCLFTLPASAQHKKEEVCTVCEFDSKVMEAAGIQNHGPFQFFISDSKDIERVVGAQNMVWLESTHFRFGSDLEPWKIPVKDKKAYRAELTELQELFPKVDPKKTSTLDRWMRVHLMAFRMEKAYQHLLGLTGYTEEQFLYLPTEQEFIDAEANGSWKGDLEKIYIDNQDRAPGMPLWVGLGQYFGMPMKFEFLMMRYEEDFGMIKRHYIGHLDSNPQRWHCTWRPPDTEPVSRSLWFGLSTEAEEMKHDQHLHNGLQHNFAINFLDGFMLYLVEAPVWLRVGLGHYMSKRNSDEYNFYDMDEGSVKLQKDAQEWEPLVRKYVVRGEAPGFADLSSFRSFGDLGFEAHLTSWSKVMFLMQKDPEKFGLWVTKLKTADDLTNNLPTQRKILKDVWGWSFAKADEEWAAWVKETYPLK